MMCRKLAAPEFQNLVMLELLDWCKRHQISLTLAEQTFRQTAPGSNMRTLLLEEIVSMLQDRKSITFNDLEGIQDFKGVAGGSVEDVEVA